MNLEVYSNIYEIQTQLFWYCQFQNQLIQKVEEYNPPENVSCKFLRWSFGKSLKRTDMRFGYEMKVIQNQQDAQLECKYTGAVCKGQYLSSTSVIILNFFLKSSMVTVTYRIVDENSKLTMVNLLLTIVKSYGSLYCGSR